jgi:hypothetical protein
MHASHLKCSNGTAVTVRTVSPLALHVFFLVPVAIPVPTAHLLLTHLLSSSPFRDVLIVGLSGARV